MNYVLQRVAARNFVRSKGRLPLDREELESWLMEFTDHMADLLDRVFDAFDDHMRVCNRPVVMRIEKP